MPFNPGTPIPPEDMADEREHRRILARGLTNALNGKLNALTTLTLNPSATTTTLADARIGATTGFHFTPLSANAATAKPFVWVSSQGKGTATITHASNAAIDQTFRVTLIG